MGFDDEFDLQAIGVGVGNVLVHIALWIHYGGLTF
jgi:hypothetical protein